MAVNYVTQGEALRTTHDTEFSLWAQERGIQTEVHYQRERILDASDFPPITLTEKQLSTLKGVNLTHVVLDHNKPQLARVQAELTDLMGDYLGNVSLVYATNGETPSISSPDLPVEYFKRPSLPNHIGVPDLVAETTKKILSEAPEGSNQWISFASADVWVMHPQRYLAYLADSVIESKELITSYCGGIGVKGAAVLPEYFLLDPYIRRNTYPGIGLMTEFFTIRADLARKTLVYWNDRSMGKLCYENFHKDIRLKPFLDASRGTVETHFRYLMAYGLKDSGEFPIVQMNPTPDNLTQYHRAYPHGIGYTSTHDDRVRTVNIEIALGYNNFLSQVPSLMKWYEERCSKLY